MTKDELIYKHTNIEGISELNWDGLRDAMDEWAKIAGENLIKWLNDNEFNPSSWSDNMQSPHHNEGARMHSSEIIKLFLKSKQ